MLAVAGLAATAEDSAISWAGRWVLDSKASTAPEGLLGLEQRIKQHGSELEIESKFPEPANGVVPLMYLGILTNSLKLNTDGSEVVNQIGPFMQTSKSTLNGSALETDWKSEVKGEPAEGHWIRTLSDDGKRMTLKVTESSTHGQSGNAELVFKKK
jgi:hypothetical protein